MKDTRQTMSLTRRLLLASLLVLPLVLGFSAAILNSAYVQSVGSSEQDTLVTQLYSLLAAAEIEGDQVDLPELTQNPHFDTPNSEYYARVTLPDGREIWQSNSLATSALPLPPSSSELTPGARTFSGARVGDQNYKTLRFLSLWEVGGTEKPYIFEIFHSQAGAQNKIHRYQKNLLIWSGGMALLLILVQISVLRWGLRPLKRLADEVTDIGNGKLDRLQASYPQELNPLAINLNALLESEQRQRERYKNSLSDLAHSLKTPLSVMRSVLDSEQAPKDAINEQIERMSNIVSHQLKRAASEVRPVFQQHRKLRPAVERITTALTKVYSTKGIQLTVDIDADIACAVDEDDLMELLGNLLENAFKYGRQKVRVSARRQDTFVELRIADDGPGVAPSLQQAILERGARADTSEKGQGIGLAIAVDILSSYNGSLSIEVAIEGGAEFIIHLPGDSK